VLFLQAVPEPQNARRVVVLVRTAPVLRLVVLQIGQRVGIEVLAVKIHAVLVDTGVDEIGHPVAGRLVAQVEQGALAVIVVALWVFRNGEKEPVPVILIDFRALVDALRLVPEDGAHAAGTAVV